MSLTWAVNDWDKQDNQWGTEGYVYMLPESAPLKDQLWQAEAWVSKFDELVNKQKPQAKKGFFGTSYGKGLNGGKDAAKYRYKAKIARDHVAAIKKKMAQPAPVAQKQPAPATPAMNKEAIKTAAFGTKEEQAASDKTDSQKEAFDLTVKGVGMAKDSKDLVKTLKGPVSGLQKGEGLIEARDQGGFGELQQIVKFALAKTPKEAYEVALDRREIYLRVNVMNEAAAKIVCLDTYFPVSALRRTSLPEMGPFSLRPIDPRNKQGTFALLGGASGDGILRKIVTNGRFVRAAVSFCAETPDKKAHMDFTVGFDWEPGIAVISEGSSGVSVVEGKKLEEAFRKAKNNPEAEVTSGGLRVFVAIKGQVVVIGVGRSK